MNTTNIVRVICLVQSNTGHDTGVISGALMTIGSDLGHAEVSNGQKASVFLIRYFLCDQPKWA